MVRTMMTIMSTVRRLLLLAAILPGSLSLEWSNSLQPDAVVYACAGETLSLPWELLLSDGDTIEDIQWFYSGRSQEMIAAIVHGQFLITPAFSERVHIRTNAGIEIDHVTSLSSGNYSVLVSARKAGQSDVVTLTSSVRVTVSACQYVCPTEGPVIVDGGQLAVQQVAEMMRSRDSQGRDQFHVALQCGAFVYTSSPPFDVLWTTPSGMTMNSSSYVNGTFLLMLPNPVQGGNYSCRIPPSATTCLHGIPSEASLSLDPIQARLAVLEARQSAMENKATSCHDQALEDHVHALESKYVALENQLKDLKDENSAMKTQLQALTNATAVQVRGLEDQMHALQATGQDLNVKVNTLQSTSRDLNAKINTLQAASEQWTNVNASAWQTQLLTLTTDSVALRDEIKTLKTDSGVVRAEVRSMETDINALRGEVGILETNSSAMATDLIAVKAENTRLKAQNQSVSFHAELYSSTPFLLLYNGDKWVMPYALTNEGYGYNTSSGIFTAPIAGTYFFVASTEVFGSHHQVGINLEMQTGAPDTRVSGAYMFSGDANNGGGRGSVHAVLRLVAGQQVWVASNGVSYVNGGSRTVFSGFLLHADP